MHIEVPYIQDEKLQARFEKWLLDRGNSFMKNKRKRASPLTFTVIVEDQQDAFIIGCNHSAIVYQLFDGPLTRTLA